MGLGFAVGMILFAGAKKVVKDGVKKRRGTRKAAQEPKAAVKGDNVNQAAKAAQPKPAVQSSTKPAAKSTPPPRTSTPTGQTEVDAQNLSAAKGEKAPPKKRAPAKKPATKKPKAAQPQNPRRSGGRP